MNSSRLWPSAASLSSVVTVPVTSTSNLHSSPLCAGGLVLPAPELAALLIVHEGCTPPSACMR